MEIHSSQVLLTEKADDSDTLFDHTRQSQIDGIRAEFCQMTIAALQSERVGYLPVGVEVPAIEASSWIKGHRNVDIHPKLVDKSTGVARLLDTGAQLSATPRQEGDLLDDSVTLIAVNGSRIPTYGTRQLSFNIGRKVYHQEALICDINQDILGMDFVDKYKLGLDWNDNETDLEIVDKKAKIRQKLTMVTVPPNLQRTSHLVGQAPKSRSSELNATTLFEVSCMKSLDEHETKRLKIEEALKLHEPEYVELIKPHPQLLEPNFKPGKPTHNVYHRIDTEGLPTKSKRRPIIQDSEKA